MPKGMIGRTHPKPSVGAQCRLLRVARSSFYYAPQGDSALNLGLMLLIDKQFSGTPFYGVRQIRAIAFGNPWVKCENIWGTKGVPRRVRYRNPMSKNFNATTQTQTRFP